MADNLIADAVAPGTPATGAAATGIQLAKGATLADMSLNGRYALFWSSSPELPGAGRYGHLYRRDVWTGRTELVDAGPAGEPANGSLYNVVRMSANGRFVLFSTNANNLTLDSAPDGGMFLRDLAQQTTEYLGLAGVGGRTLIAPWATGISPDGRYVVFRAMDPDVPNTAAQSNRRIYHYDRQERILRVLLEVPPESVAPTWITYTDPAVRFIGFHLYLTPADAPTPGVRRWMAMIRNIADGTVRQVTATVDGAPPNGDTFVQGVTSDGTILFNSTASNLVAGDTPGTNDAFVADTVRGTVERVSAATDNPAVSGGTASSISLTGRFVTFRSNVANLTPDDPDTETDAFLRDRTTGTLRRVTPPSQEREYTSVGAAVLVSTSGRFVAFDSTRSDLVTHDTNGTQDIFLRDMWTGRIIRIDVA